MAKARIVNFRVTEEQYNSIKRNAQNEGFNTVSKFIRHLALDQGYEVMKKINYLYEKFKGS